MMFSQTYHVKIAIIGLKTIELFVIIIYIYKIYKHFWMACLMFYKVGFSWLWSIERKKNSIDCNDHYDDDEYIDCIVKHKLVGLFLS